MYIVNIASELAPLSKVGGLADVLLGLSRELTWKGHNVDIIIPKYDCMDSNEVRDLTVDTQDLISEYNGEKFHNTIWMGWVENLKVYFIDTHHPRHFFDRGCIYGCDDDIERFLYFSRAALDFLFKKGLNPDILHIHDWHVSAVAPLYHDLYKNLGYNKPKVVLTIHNIQYQGNCGINDLDKIGLDGKKYLTPEKMQDPTSPTSINLLKGGIVYSDFVTTVSPSYAEEIKHEDGKGLNAVCVEYQDKLKGILNGVDYSYWNPEIDRYLPAHYSSREFPTNKKDRNTLDKKAYIRKMLRERLNLAEEHRPIVGCISRLVPQKGPELMKHAIYRTLEKGGQFILLGTSPIPSINAEFHELKHKFDDHPHVSINLFNREEFAHFIYAGSDMFVVPSIFEPCGLTQLIALKYGTVPIVRKTGGLGDTIFDVDFSEKNGQLVNGYVFKNPDPIDLDGALDRAFTCWFENPDRWRKIMINGMNQDYSWNLPATEYVEIYNKVKR